MDGEKMRCTSVGTVFPTQRTDSICFVLKNFDLLLRSKATRRVDRWSMYGIVKCVGKQLRPPHWLKSSTNLTAANGLRVSCVRAESSADCSSNQ